MRNYYLRATSLTERLKRDHERRVESRQLRVRGPIYHSLEEAKRASTEIVVEYHSITAMEQKLFAKIPDPS